MIFMRILFFKIVMDVLLRRNAKVKRIRSLDKKFERKKFITYSEKAFKCYELQS